MKTVCKSGVEDEAARKPGAFLWTITLPVYQILVSTPTAINIHD